MTRKQRLRELARLLERAAPWPLARGEERAWYEEYRRLLRGGRKKPGSSEEPGRGERKG